MYTNRIQVALQARPQLLLFQKPLTLDPVCVCFFLLLAMMSCETSTLSFTDSSVDVARMPGSYGTHKYGAAAKLRNIDTTYNKIYIVNLQ